MGIHGPREGLLASPHPVAWRGGGGAPRPLTTGMTATWIDSTEVGVPSDFYYLAANGPILARLVDSKGCHLSSEEILVDREPGFAHGERDSPGDFVAAGEGTCIVRGGRATRWSYFVAAPGYGPATGVGIPGSGLYLVVAVTRDSPRAHHRLGKLLSGVRFGDSPISDFYRVLRSTTI